MDLQPCPLCDGDPLLTIEEDFFDDDEKIYGFSCCGGKMNTLPAVRATSKEAAASAWNKLEDPGPPRHIDVTVHFKLLGPSPTENGVCLKFEDERGKLQFDVTIDPAADQAAVGASIKSHIATELVDFAAAHIESIREDEPR